MKTIKILIIAAVIGISFPMQFKAQDYSTAVGLRLGETSGLTFKQGIGGDHAIEAILGLYPNSYTITGVFEKYIHLGAPGLNLYYGIGGHFAFGTQDRYYYLVEHRGYYFINNGDNTGIGIDGMLGIEFKLPLVPIAFSLEIKPFAEFDADHTVYTTLDPGLGVKLTF